MSESALSKPACTKQLKRRGGPLDYEMGQSREVKSHRNVSAVAFSVHTFNPSLLFVSNN